jgi:hypothetical protein
MDTGIGCVLILAKEKSTVFAQFVWLMEAVKICVVIISKSTNARIARELASASTMINEAGAKNAPNQKTADQVYANMAKKGIVVPCASK